MSPGGGDVIPAENRGVFVIITVTVRPENQQALIDLLCAAGDIVDVPGLLSRNFFRSLDGTQVINHMHWASKKAYEEGGLLVPMFKEFRAEVRRLMVDSVSNIYELVGSS